MKHYPKKFILAILIAFFLFQNNATGKVTKGEDNSSTPLEKIELRRPTSQKIIKEGEVIVKFKKSKINLENKAGRSKSRSFQGSKGLQEIDSINELNAKLLKSDKKTAQLIGELKNDPNVKYAEANTIRHPLTIPNDSFFFHQWSLNNTGQTFQSSQGTNISGTADADIDAAEAWDIENPANQEIIVAVIDTGARFSHEDLTANMWDGTTCKDENNVAIPGGCPNHGWDFKGDDINSDDNPDDTSFLYCTEYDTDGETCLTEEEISGHGTFISGVIGGVHNNAKGISGISSKNKIKVMPIRFALDTFTEIQAISFAKNNGAKIINASYGGSEFSQLEKDAIDAFPGIFVAAAGNDGINNETAHFYPSDYDSSNIISVTSTDQDDSLSYFSNFGNISIDIAAPGQNIASTHVSSNSAYGVGDGTSFAAPFVSASTALVYSVNPLLSQTEAKNIILNSGDTLPALANITVTGKRLNLNNAYTLAKDSLAPEISNGLPTGMLATNTLQVILTVQTDVAATCKYAFTDSTAYDDPNFSYPFETTGETTHTKTLDYAPGTTNGQTFNFYVRCNDGNGNINETPYLINFSVASDAEPILSDGAPSGILPAGTTETLLELFTNEFVTCKASETPGTSYDLMEHTLQDAGTYHSVPITGLENGTSYTYYVRCSYPSGTLNTTDFPISFSVASPDITPPNFPIGLSVQ